MLIELQHLGFLNKGAALMLLAIIDAINKRYKNVKFTMIPNNSNEYKKMVRLGIYPKFAHRRFRVNWNFVANFIPPEIRNRYGIVIDKEVDIILNAAGFKFGEQWGYKPSCSMAKMCRKWKEDGKKIILLPQAFGPFKSPKIKTAIKDIVSYADIVYAREEKSYKNLIAECGENPKIKISPDFTNLIEGKVPEKFRYLKNSICIIPNFQMIKKTSIGNEKYIDLIKFIINELLRSNTVFILIHEGEKDIEIARKINSLIEKKVEIVSEDDPIYLKGIIGQSKAVISSRFHGLVSALSQGVPSLSTSWSHKYEYLLKDYNYTEGLIALDSSPEDIKEKITMITDNEHREKIVDKLIESSKIQKQKSKDMWSEVYKIIDSKYKDISCKSLE